MSRTEAQIRKELIDVKLREAGWNVNDRTHVIEEFDIVVGLPEGVYEARTKYDGRQFSDYVLLGKDRKPLGCAPKSNKTMCLHLETQLV
ncbi:MAG: hypothetical protein BWY65_00052 [Firmicutes bacterium ADurb.Bin373]|nr:MAG: hypothetical protein BWY65_00052 [Firmicutes bacterium ADurb.Bin373]